MACGAVLIARIGQVMRSSQGENAVRLAPKIARAIVAFQAYREHHGPLQHARVRRAVRHMAAPAAVYPDRRVLEYEGAALIGVTIQTRLFVSFGLHRHPGLSRHAPAGSKGAMRIMTIGTSHETLVHAVFKGHRKLRADIRMAVITQGSLRFCE